MADDDHPPGAIRVARALPPGGRISLWAEDITVEEMAGIRASKPGGADYSLDDLPDDDYPPEAIRVLRDLSTLPKRTPGEDPLRDRIEAWATEFLADPGEPTPADRARIEEMIAMVRSAPDVPPDPGDELPEGL